jgi:hypothetical protein
LGSAEMSKAAKLKELIAEKRMEEVKKRIEKL